MVVHDTYSRAVAWLKILLPLLALAILSTLFLVARAIDPAQDLPYADVDVDELADAQRIGRPRYSGVTGDGAAVSVSAASARPDPANPQRLTGTDVTAIIEMPDGSRIDISAATVALDNETRLATLAQGVTATTSDGYELRTGTVTIALDRTRIASDQPTTLTGPIGRISADSFRLTDENPGERPYVLVFKGRVKLVYDPNE